jgi:hypothetical protein
MRTGCSFFYSNTIFKLLNKGIFVLLITTFLPNICFAYSNLYPCVVPACRTYCGFDLGLAHTIVNPDCQSRADFISFESAAYNNNYSNTVIEVNKNEKLSKSVLIGNIYTGIAWQYKSCMYFALELGLNINTFRLDLDNSLPIATIPRFAFLLHPSWFSSNFSQKIEYKIR